MPSYTFPSLANAFVLRGASPVFVDVCEHSLCLDPLSLEAACSSKTRAIAVVHFGAGCEIEEVLSFADSRDLAVVEDTALAFNTKRGDRFCGSFATMGTLSFHDTKDVSAGECGALLVRDASLVERAHVLLEKGTNRVRFARREVRRYEWQDLGGSYSPSELCSAYLSVQLEAADRIRARRLDLVQRYREGFEDLEREGELKLPNARHNAHMFCILLEDDAQRDSCRDHLASRGIASARHYVPLHMSPYGRKIGRVAGAMPVTESLDRGLLRLPLYPDLADGELDDVVACVRDFLRVRER